MRRDRIATQSHPASLKIDAMIGSSAESFGIKTASGMGRFFSPENLGRYRKLASGAVDEAEQHQLLQDLAEEMSAFRREACVCRHHRKA